jgi:hypothetical protein
VYVYKVTVDTQNKQISVDTKSALTLNVANANAQHPALVYLGEDDQGNRYAAVVYVV